jgi:hypothetical protein
MAYKVTREIKVPTSTYTDNSGQQKSKFLQVGAIWKDDATGKSFITLEAWFNPAAIARKEGASSIILALFEPETTEQRNARMQQRANTTQQTPAPAARGDAAEDDIPF